MGYHVNIMQCMQPNFLLTGQDRGGWRLCEAPRWNLEGGSFYIYETVVNREKVDERTEVFVLLKQKKLEQKNESLINMDVTKWTKLIDFKSPFLSGDLKPYR